MGRKKSFNEKDIVKRMGETFIKYGYEGTSLDDLVKATGLLRGSLYSTFGSKRGMFISALLKSIADDPYNSQTLNLVTVAMMELTSNDKQLLDIIKKWAQNLKKDELISIIGNAVISRSQILKGEKNGK